MKGVPLQLPHRARSFAAAFVPRCCWPQLTSWHKLVQPRLRASALTPCDAGWSRPDCVRGAVWQAPSARPSLWSAWHETSHSCRVTPSYRSMLCRPMDSLVDNELAGTPDEAASAPPSRLSSRKPSNCCSFTPLHGSMVCMALWYAGWPRLDRAWRALRTMSWQTRLTRLPVCGRQASAPPSHLSTSQTLKLLLFHAFTLLHGAQAGQGWTAHGEL